MGAATGGFFQRYRGGWPQRWDGLDRMLADYSELGGSGESRADHAL